MKTINIKLIRIDGGTQQRVSIDQDAVSEYAEAIDDGAEFPPVLVYFDGVDYWLVDGFHRYWAHMRLGRASIKVDDEPGTLEDAQLRSVGVNDKHGLRLTNADKRKKVTFLLASPKWSAWSDREVARKCGVGHTLVSVIRASLSAPDSEEAPAQRTYTTKHGTTATMNTGAIGRSNDDEAAAGRGTVDPAPPPPAAAPAPTLEAAAPAAAPAAPPPLEELPEADHIPSAGEIDESQATEEADREALNLLLEADDKLAAAHAKLVQQGALIRILEGRIVGLTNEAAQAVRLALHWRGKFERSGKA
jgi:hypothetical protein